MLVTENNKGGPIVRRSRGTGSVRLSPSANLCAYYTMILRASQPISGKLHSERGKLYFSGGKMRFRRSKLIFRYSYKRFVLSGNLNNIVHFGFLFFCFGIYFGVPP